MRALLFHLFIIRIGLIESILKIKIEVEIADDEPLVTFCLLNPNYLILLQWLVKLEDSSVM